MKKSLAPLLSSSLGNILEWYDFGLFAIFSALISRLFFPTSDPQASLLATVTIFAIGFLCRPIGALIFGYLGDKAGRARTLRLSILMITLPTIAIGCLPTYQQIGILAPLLLMLTRICQGISIGGEYSGNIIYLAESAPYSYRAMLTAFASSGANLGILLAALVGIIICHAFDEKTVHAWAWRLPYIISGLLSLIIYKLRLNLPESPAFEKQLQTKHISSNPIRFALKNNIPQILRTLGLVCMGSTFYYYAFIYLPVLINANKYLSISITTELISILMAMMMLIAPLAGLVSDRLGRKQMLIFNALMISISVIPASYFAIHHSLFLIPALFFFAIISAFEQGVTGAAIVENFPLPARYTGISIGYNLGNGILGGTVPLICEWLMIKTQHITMPAIYITGWALITLITSVFFISWKNKTA